MMEIFENDNDRYAFTEEELDEVFGWMNENTDKWENWTEGFVWLIPEEEVLQTVPERVRDYFESQRVAEEKEKQFYKLMSSMGVNN